MSDPAGLWTCPARVVGIDDGLDLAVLRASDTTLNPAALGDSRTMREGDQVHVVGNARGGAPRGRTGTVLDTEATIATTAPATGTGSSDAATGSLSGMIEIQARVVPGDSGGAVLDHRGRVVAMLLAYVPTTDSNAVGDRGYAIPINHVMLAVDRLITWRTDRRAVPRFRAGALRGRSGAPWDFRRRRG